MFKVIYSKSAVKVLRKMPAPIASHIRDKINALARETTAMASVKKLKGSEDYRLRVGNWRVIYAIDQGTVTITVIKIGARGDVYKH